MKLTLIGHDDRYAVEQLQMSLFDRTAEGETVSALHRGGTYITAVTKITYEGRTVRASRRLKAGEETVRLRRRILQQSCYLAAVQLLETVPAWGALAGVRPTKISTKHLLEGGTPKSAQRQLEQLYYVTPERSRLAVDCSVSTVRAANLLDKQDISLYVGIPFCPTRCSYCSFVSRSVGKRTELLDPYLQALYRELALTGELLANSGRSIRTIYIGGGTPTTRSAEELKTLIDCIEKNYDTKNIREFTIEAGRPDTIDADKLRVIKNSTVTRISINPQTLNDDVLCEIGRKHTAQQCIDSFDLARRENIDNINMDLIAGLPTDTLESFEKTLEGILALSPENVTLHTLSVKRAADLRDEGAKIHAASEGVASKMVDYAYDRLIENGYEPYYLYRQKNMLESLENVGYSKRGYEGLYNVYIMDETHTILAVGAGAVTKLKNHETDKLERIFNFKFPYEYISRYNEIIERKGLIYDFYRKG